MKGEIQNLRTEFLINPLGIDILNPRLSWELFTKERGLQQKAYRVQCARTKNNIDSNSNLLWDSGIINESTTIIRYQGLALISSERVFWHVKIWDQEGTEWDWSETVWWEMGLLKKSDWKASWIDPELDINPVEFNPAAYIRKEFQVNSVIKEARLYITSYGNYESWINNHRVGNQIFTPGRTEYHKRLQYQCYDVTDLLNEGNNAIGVILGDGWWRGANTALSIRNRFGTRISLLAQLKIDLENGESMLILSDDSWKATSEGPIRKCDLKFGETYDGRMELVGWSRPGYNDDEWHDVQVKMLGYDNLIATMGPKILEKEKIFPKVIQTSNGERILDFGQNFSGYIEMKVKELPVGSKISLVHGEVLDTDGNFTQRNIRLMKSVFTQSKELYQLDTYIHGESLDSYKPHFSVKGFRYVKLMGYPEDIVAENFTGIAVYSDMRTTGYFECSNPLINQFYSNTLWSQKSNFLDIPTDCPTRERSGWTGDAQVFSLAGSILMDTLTFFTKWMKDVEASQRDDGMIRNLSPNEFSKDMFHEGSAGWGDAGVIIPWTIWKIFGDTTIITNQYNSMKAWVEYERHHAQKTHWARKINPKFWFGASKKLRPYLWDTKFHFGEWMEADLAKSMRKIYMGLIKRLFFSDPEVATAYFAYSSKLLAEMAKAIGKQEDALEYSNLAKKVRQTYQYFFLKDGMLESKRQAHYVRPIALKLAPKAMYKKLIDQLAQLVEQHDFHVGTGFLSTRFLCQVLSENGYVDYAYELMLQSTRPSWLYEVTKNATTIWENWNGIDEEGNVQLSMNHYSYGAQVYWLFSSVLGIKYDPKVAGFKHYYLEPKPGGGLTYAKGSYQSIHGNIYSEWIWDSTGEEIVKYVCKVPPNTNATVKLPVTRSTIIKENGINIQNISGISDIVQEDNTISFKATPGTYILDFI
ncbi:MAG: family 78 glycoside hydrolase catalytic domain [Promethearchaeota archaeon]